MIKRLLYIGNKLSKHGKNPTAIEKLGPLLESEGFIVVYSSSIFNKFTRFLDMIFATVKFAKKSDYVLIDTYSTANYWYAFAVSQICRIMDTKYIPILHGGNLPMRLKKSPVLSAWIFKNAHVLVAPSDYLANEFINAGFKNVQTISNPIDVSQFPFKEREHISPKLLWLRSMAKIYNPELAIDVMQIVQKKYPTASLTMVGPDAESMVSLMKERAATLRLNIQFTLALPREKWIEIADNCDIFLNTTNVDNAPASMIEASALGLAIVSTNVGGISYLFKDKIDALLVNSNDAEEMAKAVFSCCENTGATLYRIKEARKLSESFDWNQVRDLWKSVLV